jgi:hypothetical protein
MVKMSLVPYPELIPPPPQPASGDDVPPPGRLCAVTGTAIKSRNKTEANPGPAKLLFNIKDTSVRVSL